MPVGVLPARLALHTLNCIHSRNLYKGFSL
ncbi:hypothetical protein L1281_001949 [Neisseria sp. HSC-16F19]|nr:hypothetical protein [Neisseria sp. HSC-16F19]